MNPTGRVLSTPHTHFLFFLSSCASFSSLLGLFSGHQPAFDLRSICLSRDGGRGAVAHVQLVGSRRVIFGQVCVQRHLKRRERAKESARRTEQTQRGEGERRTDFSGTQLVLPHSGCAQQIRVSSGDKQKQIWMLLWKIVHLKQACIESNVFSLRLSQESNAAAD